jgi:hypothetical protein
LQHLDRKEQLAPVLLSEQESLQPPQWSSRNPDTIAAFEERVRLHTNWALNHPANGFNLGIRDTRRLSRAAYHAVNTRCGKDRKPMDEGAAEEYVTREKGERDSLDAVFPLVSCRVDGKERFKPFTSQHLMHNFLMLMPSVKSVPRIANIQFCHRCISLDPGADSSAA